MSSSTPGSGFNRRIDRVVRIISNRSGLFVVASDMAYSPYDEQTALMKKDSCLVTTKGFRVFAIRGPQTDELEPTTKSPRVTTRAASSAPKRGPGGHQSLWRGIFCC